MSDLALKVKHLSKGRDMGKAAVALDNAGKLKEALNKYIEASEQLMLALRYSKGDGASIRTTLSMYPEFGYSQYQTNSLTEQSRSRLS